MQSTAAPIDRRRQRAIQRTREEILEAAAVTFARRGFRGTTMSEIAAAAGYTPPTLYSYFRSKSEIFNGLLDQVLAEIDSTYEREEAPRLTFEQRLHLLVRRQLELAERRRHAFAVFFAIRPLEQDLRSGARGETGFDFCVSRLARWIRESSSEQERRGWTPDELACALAGMIHAFVRRSLRSGGEGKLAREARVIAGLLLGGMRGGERPTRRGRRRSRNEA